MILTRSDVDEFIREYKNYQFDYEPARRRSTIEDLLQYSFCHTRNDARKYHMKAAKNTCHRLIGWFQTIPDQVNTRDAPPVIRAIQSGQNDRI